MKTVFWLLDVNYEVKDHKPEVWIWGIDDDDKRILIIDRNFLPYFYLVVKQKENPQPIIETLESLKADYPLIKKFELVNRRFFGKSVTAIKVVCQDPTVISKHARSLEKINGIKNRLEDDIRYSMRYLIDNNVIPCSWHEIEVEEIENNFGVQVDKLYVASTFPRTIEKNEIPELRILAFSTISYSRQGAPRPEKNPVIIISVCTNVGDEKQFVAKGSDDKAVIESFVKYVRNFDPDILAGYDTNRQDWPYLLSRSKKLGIKLSVTRANTEPHRSVYGHVSVTGRANIDFFGFADELPEVKIKTLENVADFFGVMKIEKHTLIEDIDFSSYWENPEKRSILLKFSRENTQSIIGIAKAMLDFAVQLSSLVSLPLDHVGTVAVGFRVEWYLIKEAYRIGELIPKRRERPYISYVGGVVLKPKPGVHENVTILDFKAMYPNIMITENLSPDTYVSSSEPEPACGVNIAPEVKHRFRKEPAGFYKVMLSNV
ncbi:MAG: DNA polymerase II, partial [Candidatus Bathyarchaeota archaeon]|nr:DNA polymerase II [Candidatus Bathyarchaeota archaeon]